MNGKAGDLVGQDWTQAEVDLIVADYFEMLGLEIRGIPFVKSHRNAALRQLVDRSAGSIERKHQNISAVLSRLGRPWIRGYKPLPNFQNLLLSAVERHLTEKGEAAWPSPVEAEGGGAESILFVSPPEARDNEPPEPEILKRMVRKFDPAIRDARNRALGKRGEEAVFHFERDRLLELGLSDLAKKVRWVAQEDGDGAGYDIRSYREDGSERLLEVKTTNGFERTPFFLSENERLLSVERPESFRIVRLYDFFVAPKAFRIRPPLDEVVSLRPAVYKVSLL